MLADDAIEDDGVGGRDGVGGGGEVGMDVVDAAVQSEALTDGAGGDDVGGGGVDGDGAGCQAAAQEFIVDAAGAAANVEQAERAVSVLQQVGDEAGAASVEAGAQIGVGLGFGAA